MWQEVDPKAQRGLIGDGEESLGMLSDIATAIPGIDEAMSFAEVLKQVRSSNTLLTHSALPCSKISFRVGACVQTHGPNTWRCACQPLCDGPNQASISLAIFLPGPEIQPALPV